MAHEAAGTGRTAGRSPETVDRMMVGVCGAIWLVLLAVSVFATVAMVRLASGHTGSADRQSSWLLYSIIVVSALVILGAIPLLMRARRNALADPRPEVSAEASGPPARSVEAGKARVFGVDPYAPRHAEMQPARVSETLVDRLWLRGTMALLSGMGLALIAVAIGGYLLADFSDTAAWVALGLAGLITVSLPAMLNFYQRQLGEAVGDAGE
jgi:hypothetical protein